MFSVRNLSKIYTGRHGVVRALDKLSFDIERGSFVTVTGSSGSGKSTLLLTLGGLIRPTEGEVSFGGISMFDSTGFESSPIPERESRICPADIQSCAIFIRR